MGPHRNGGGQTERKGAKNASPPLTKTRERQGTQRKDCPASRTGRKKPTRTPRGVLTFGGKGTNPAGNHFNRKELQKHRSTLTSEKIRRKPILIVPQERPVCVRVEEGNGSAHTTERRERKNIDTSPYQKRPVTKRILKHKKEGGKNFFTSETSRRSTKDQTQTENGSKTSKKLEELLRRLLGSKGEKRGEKSTPEKTS